jgi:hypothetical protein
VPADVSADGVGADTEAIDAAGVGVEAEVGAASEEVVAEGVDEAT